MTEVAPLYPGRAMDDEPDFEANCFICSQPLEGAHVTIAALRKAMLGQHIKGGSLLYAHDDCARRVADARCARAWASEPPPRSGYRID
jgi:hypothetical protein